MPINMLDAGWMAEHSLVINDHFSLSGFRFVLFTEREDFHRAHWLQVLEIFIN